MMRSILRKIVAPAIIFLLVVAITLLYSSISYQLASAIPSRFETTVNVVLQILSILSGLFLVHRLLNTLVWDNIVFKARGTAVPRLIKDLTAAVIMILGITIIVGVVLQRPVTGIWATSGAFGVVLGFALRSLILDAFTGLSINIDNSYKIGDWVHVHSRNRAEYIGYILEINWRTTRLKTTDNNIIIIPNSLIGQSIVTNFSSPEERSRFELLFCFDAARPSEQVVRVLLAGVKGAILPNGIEAEPEPSVRINRVTDAGVEYRIRYWIYPAKLSPPRARHAVIESVLRNLRTAGIQLANPKQDVYFARQPPLALNADSKEDRVTLLSTVDLFQPLKLEALQALASHMKQVTFKSLDKVVTVGDQSHSMFLVTEGLLDVYVRDDADDQDVKVGHITSGQFFGEMALLTGKTRSATVIASTDVVSYEITYACMRELFRGYPDMLEVIGSVVAERQLSQQRILEGMHQTAMSVPHESFADEILVSIRNFFGLGRRR